MRTAEADASAAGQHLATATRESTVSIQVARWLAGAVEHVGVPTVRLLRAVGLAAEQFDTSEARISRADVDRVCEVAMDLTGDPALGLHWGDQPNDSAFKPVSHLVTHAASLREGIESLCRFVPLISEHPGYELLEHDDRVTVRCLHTAGESAGIQRFRAEATLIGFARLVRSFSVHARPERVSFEHSAPTYAAEYAPVFDRAVQFGQPITEIVFDRAVLDAASPHRDEDLHEALRVLAERRIQRLTQHVPYALRVRALIVEHGRPQRMAMDAVSRALGLSVRSLRRRLAEEGKSFHEIENDALAAIAKHLLRGERRTIQETAYEMGFSDTTAFHRAFKRWTGTTPSAYRDRSAIP